MRKIQFAEGGEFAEFAEEGYDLPIETELLHRFRLVDGVVVDTYDGVSDEEVKAIDHAKATEEALNHVDLDGNPDPLSPPPPLDFESPVPEGEL